ncbi:MAG: hypothetical protein IT495_17510 [Gammaproteobacteria bacterium]|nr:hypothetical protein [Gammaproteobacteria bacterium]
MRARIPVLLGIAALALASLPGSALANGSSFYFGYQQGPYGYRPPVVSGYYYPPPVYVAPYPGYYYPPPPPYWSAYRYGYAPYRHYGPPYRHYPRYRPYGYGYPGSLHFGFGYHR